MKLVYPEIDAVFEFGNGHFPSAAIENQNLFYRFTDDLCRQCNGDSGEAVLSRNNNPVPISGNLELITTFLPFDINNKKLIAKIAAKLEKLALVPENLEKSQKLLGNIENFMLDLAFQNDLDLTFPKLSISGLFKSAGICIKGEEWPLAEKILAYMDLMSSNGLASVFVLINIRSFLDDETMEKLTASCCCHEYNIMLIDNREYPKLSLEKRTVIDADLCEF